MVAFFLRLALRGFPAAYTSSRYRLFSLEELTQRLSGLLPVYLLLQIHRQRFWGGLRRGWRVGQLDRRQYVGVPDGFHLARYLLDLCRRCDVGIVEQHSLINRLVDAHVPATMGTVSAGGVAIWRREIVRRFAEPESTSLAAVGHHVAGVAVLVPLARGRHSPDRVSIHIASRLAA